MQVAVGQFANQQAPAGAADRVAGVAPCDRATLAAGLDRATRVACVAGSVVSLVAFGILLERGFVAGNRTPSIGYGMALLASLLVAYSSLRVLRRSIRAEVDRVGSVLSDDRRLVEATRSLGRACGNAEACELTAQLALGLIGSGSVHLLLRNGGDGAVFRAAAAGVSADSDYARCPDLLHGFAEAENSPSFAVAPDGAEALPGCQLHVLAAKVEANGHIRGALVALRFGAEGRFSLRESDALDTLADLAAVGLRASDAQESARNLTAHITDVLATLIDINLGYNQGHARRVAMLAHSVGRGLGADPETLKRLHVAALLHDIGTLAIEPDSRDSAAACRRHPVLGFRMLSGVRAWRDVARCVLHHHENFDGTGYPGGLSAAEIPLESRIIAVCDAYDVMTSESSYRDPVRVDEARLELEKNAGTQFDPVIVVKLVEYMA